MKETWEFCRKLGNPERIELLRLVYARKDAGITVGEAVDCSKLGQPSVSAYFHQLLDLGLLRRERGGRIVAYYPERANTDSSYAEIIKMLYERFSSGSRDTGFIPAFRVFGNALRLRIIRYVARYEVCTKESLSSVFGKSIRSLSRDLEPAVRGGVLVPEFFDGSDAYRYLPPSDSIAWRVVNLSR